MGGSTSRSGIVVGVATAAFVLTACVSVSVGTPPATTYRPKPSPSSRAMPPTADLVDAIATHLREELARVPDDGWAAYVEIVYERGDASLVYAIVLVDDDDLPGAWLAVMATAFGDHWSVVGSNWARRGSVAASDINLVGVAAYPYDPALLGFVGREIVAVAVVDPTGERHEGTIVDGAVDLPAPTDGALVASGENGIRFVLLVANQVPILSPGRDADTSPAATAVVAQVARAVVEGNVEDVAAQTEPAMQRALRALADVLQQEGSAWSIAGTPSAYGKAFAVELDGGGTSYTLYLSTVTEDGRPVVHGGQLSRS